MNQTTRRNLFLHKQSLTLNRVDDSTLVRQYILLVDLSSCIFLFRTSTLNLLLPCTIPTLIDI